MIEQERIRARQWIKQHFPDMEPSDLTIELMASFSASADPNQCRDESARLRKILEKYAYCRHAQINCNCTMEARAALFEPQTQRTP